MTTTYSVELGNRSYRIFFTHNDCKELKANLKQSFSSNLRYAIIMDQVIEDTLENNFSGLDFLPHPPAVKITLKAGEQSKSISGLEKIYHELVNNGIDRSGAIVAIGGGVIGDLAGYAAASYMRGIGLYQIPTTLLAMVDSSIGGKTGINLPTGKNLVGAFYQPKAVFIHSSFLQTLPQNEFNAGMAEIIKYGLLADTNLFSQLQMIGKLSSKHKDLPNIIRTCCKIKASIVRKDEKETDSSGGRALLNLGHTFAHAIEAASGYNQYLHGEAVAVGLVLAGKLSLRLDYLSQKDLDAIIKLIKEYDLPISLRNPLPIATLIDAMRRDKKILHGKFNFIVLERIGKAIIIDNINDHWINDLWLEAGATVN